MCLAKENKKRIPRYAVTARERELLQLAANGLSNKQIAGQLNISADTVDSHNRNLTKCLSAKNMKEAIAIGIRKGIIQ